MRRPGLLLFCIVLGVSLFNFFFFFHGLGQNLTLTIADIVVGGLILYAFFVNRLSLRSPILYATLFFAGVSLLSGLVNAGTDHTFNLGDFSIEYIRILGLVAMVFLLPSLQRKIGHDRLAQATLWVVRLHALVVVADSFKVFSINWLAAVGIVWTDREEAYRPGGLFEEPSFFGIYMGLSLFYILQVERNTGNRYIRVFDIILFSLALIASASISSIGILSLFLLVLVIMRSGMISKVKVLISVLVLAFLLGGLATTLPDTGPGRRLTYLKDRVSILRPSQFEDASGRQRLIGSTLLMREVLKEAPLLGTGLGGTNLHRLFNMSWQFDSPPSLTLTPILVVAATGIIGFLPFVFIYGWTLKMPESRLIGVSLVAVAFMWGGPFEPILWWYICLAVSLRSLAPEKRQIVSRLETRRLVFT